jgi:uncharacterized phiE125 gp8 family phage protein
MMGDSLTLQTAPSVSFVDDAVLWAHLRLDLTGSPAEPYDKALVDAYRDAVQSHLDGVDGVLGRALITQTWSMTLNGFPVCYDRIHGDQRITLPLPPLQSVASITYIDLDGVQQTLAPSAYRVLMRGTDRGAVVPAYGMSWPATRAIKQSVTVTFVAGYGDTAADVPKGIQQAALLLMTDLYENRSAHEVGTIISANRTVDALLMPFRMFF